MRDVIKILLMCLVMALLFGVLRDIALAHLCVEYFSIARPRVIESTSPLNLGLVWGLISTWWVGLLLGAVLAVASRSTTRPGRTWRELWPKFTKLLVYAGLMTIIGWSIGSIAVQREWYLLDRNIAEAIEPASQSRFVGAWWGSLAGEATLILGCLAFSLVIFLGRRETEQPAAEQPNAASTNPPSSSPQ